MPPKSTPQLPQLPPTLDSEETSAGTLQCSVPPCLNPDTSKVPAVGSLLLPVASTCFFIVAFALMKFLRHRNKLRERDYSSRFHEEAFVAIARAEALKNKQATTDTPPTDFQPTQPLPASYYTQSTSATIPQSALQPSPRNRNKAA